MHVYTRLQKHWHATSVYNEWWDPAKSYPNFPGRKCFIMRKDFPWIMREVNHWLCICANISHKGDGSCRSWIKLIRCQRFCNRVYLKSFLCRHFCGRTWETFFFPYLSFPKTASSSFLCHVLLTDIVGGIIRIIHI